MKIIVDTREKQPISFASFENLETIHKKLDTGDYTIQGYEEILAVERKASVLEFYNNITEKRFWKEMERLSKFKHKYILFEFPISDVINFPDSVDLPPKIKKRLKISPKYLMKCIDKIELNLEIKIIWCNNKLESTKILKDLFIEIVSCNN